MPVELPQTTERAALQGPPLPLAAEGPRGEVQAEVARPGLRPHRRRWLQTPTCLSAFRAIVWKACSTLMASLALVSKSGMLFLL